MGYIIDSERCNISREYFKIPLPLQKRASQIHPGFRLHLLRHTFITRALMAGQPPVKVAKWVGDSMKIIIHVNEEQALLALNRAQQLMETFEGLLRDA